MSDERKDPDDNSIQIDRSHDNTTNNNTTNYNTQNSNTYNYYTNNYSQPSPFKKIAKGIIVCFIILIAVMGIVGFINSKTADDSLANFVISTPTVQPTAIPTQTYYSSHPIVTPTKAQAQGNKISGMDSSADGVGNVITGMDCRAIGNYNEIAGMDNYVKGDYNVVPGMDNHIEGNNNKVTGMGNTVKGNNNIVAGNGKTVIGDNQIIL